jgi:hypothetical protein
MRGINLMCELKYNVDLFVVFLLLLFEWKDLI